MFGVFPKIVAFGVWRLRALFAGPNDSSSDWRVIGLLTGVALEIIVSAIIILSFVLGCRLYSKGIILGVGFSLSAAALLLGLPTTAYLDTLVGKYQEEFRHCSGTVRLVGTALTVMVVIGAIVLTVKSVGLARQLPEVMCFG